MMQLATMLNMVAEEVLGLEGLLVQLEAVLFMGLVVADLVEQAMLTGLEGREGPGHLTP